MLIAFGDLPAGSRSRTRALRPSLSALEGKRRCPPSWVHLWVRKFWWNGGACEGVLSWHSIFDCCSSQRDLLLQGLWSPCVKAKVSTWATVSCATSWCPPSQEQGWWTGPGMEGWAERRRLCHIIAARLAFRPLPGRV